MSIDDDSCVAEVLTTGGPTPADQRASVVRSPGSVGENHAGPTSPALSRRAIA
jgi:hypothetical protein